MEDILKLDTDDKEQEIKGECPLCDYPLVDEMGIIVCYQCGWSNDEEQKGYCEE
jgi:uncharacterized Zn finger protein (UPF0148 family)